MSDQIIRPNAPTLTELSDLDPIEVIVALHKRVVAAEKSVNEFREKFSDVAVQCEMNKESVIENKKKLEELETLIYNIK